jgi:hypothetical protein
MGSSLSLGISDYFPTSYTPVQGVCVEDGYCNYLAKRFNFVLRGPAMRTAPCAASTFRIAAFVLLESGTGTLWEGRYRSSPIETDAYLLACCRDVELNPVRAHMSDDPAAYPWSSYRWHAGIGNQFDWLVGYRPVFRGTGEL